MKHEKIIKSMRPAIRSSQAKSFQAIKLAHDAGARIVCKTRVQAVALHARGIMIGMPIEFPIVLNNNLKGAIQ